ncbi:MAG: alpha/beta fold hydrolase [Gammaproteobacteria bacterium]|nr:alpha/beta fold hydrolase [Gammaproteobacteria bacterium]
MTTPSDSAPDMSTDRATERPGAGEFLGDLNIANVLAALGQGAQLGPAMTEAVNFYQELFKIALGTSDVAPDNKDWRFKDDAWSQNPFYKRVGQAYLAWSKALNNFAEHNQDWRARERAKLGADVLTSMWSPTNIFLGNPAALKRAVETGGGSVVEGLRNYFEDLAENRGMPSQVDRSAFTLGENLAATPGAVVFRSETLELIQYQPQTPQVSRRPVLVIPPQIGKYYFLDLSPDRSLLEYSVSQGIQTFVISWRNPTSEHANWDLDHYVNAILEATDAVRVITGSQDLNAMGFCAGGITMTAVLGYLNAVGDPRIQSMTYAVTLLDFESEAMIGALRTPHVLQMAQQHSTSQGIIKGEDLGLLFTWMRPNDLVWNYWVNNYLMGKKPASFDILVWNVDSTNLPAALHADFLELFQNNALCKPGAREVLGEAVDISKITTDTFVIGGLTDHLTPWQGCYRTTQLLGGEPTFVLSSSGHIASLVNPPGNPKSNYHTGPEPGPNPDAWLRESTKHVGSCGNAGVNGLKRGAGSRAPHPQSSATHNIRRWWPHPVLMCTADELSTT